MLDKISRFLFRGESKSTQIRGSIEPFCDRYEKPSTNQVQNLSTAFFSSIKGLGHAEYPILDKSYSPSSRVPCTDLVPFISKCIIQGDIDSIKIVMRAVIEGNPGLGIGSEWIDERIDNVLSIPFENYVSFSSPNAIPELKALFIVAEKDGGGREFLITKEISLLISWVCIAHNPLWSMEISSLAKKANSWIEIISKDAPYWEDYGLFDVEYLPSSYVENDFRSVISSLSPAARMQLFYTVVKGGGFLKSMTSYEIRNLGINTEKTSKELIDLGLVSPSFSKEIIELSYSRKELADFCMANGVAHRKSWNKTKLVDVLQKKDPALLEGISRSKGLVMPNYEYYSELRNIVKVAEEHQVGFKLLCFA